MIIDSTTGRCHDRCCNRDWSIGLKVGDVVTIINTRARAAAIEKRQ